LTTTSVVFVEVFWAAARVASASFFSSSACSLASWAAVPLANGSSSVVAPAPAVDPPVPAGLVSPAPPSVVDPPSPSCGEVASTSSELPVVASQTMLAASSIGTFMKQYSKSSLRYTQPSTQFSCGLSLGGSFRIYSPFRFSFGAGASVTVLVWQQRGGDGHNAWKKKTMRSRKL